MKNVLNILTVMLLISATVSVSAFSQKDLLVSNSVYLFDEPKDVLITITNNSTDAQELELGLVGPKELHYEFLNAPKFLPAKSSFDVTLRLEPVPYLKNVAYKSTLLTTLGVEQVRKEINIVFVEKTDETISEPVQEPQNVFESMGTGFVGLFAFENSNFELMVNILLFLIVIVLLAMLIARLTERRA